MSTSPDELVTILSRWLAGHATDDAVLRQLEAAELGELTPAQADALAELRAELLTDGDRGELQRAARETLELLALGE